MTTAAALSTDELAAWRAFLRAHATVTRRLEADLLAEHDLHDWSFAFNRRKRAFGLCDYTRRTIFLSADLTELNDEAEVSDTLLHEIAHALAGHKAGQLRCPPLRLKMSAKAGNP